MKTWQLWLRLMGNAPGTLAVLLLLQLLRMAAQFAPALVIRRMFDRLPVAGGLTPELRLLVALLAATALAQVVIFVSATWFDSHFRNLASGQMRLNAIEGIYRRPAALALPMPVGDVVMRLGPGIPQITKPLVFVLSQILNGLTAAAAVGVMAAINLPLALAALAPLAAAGVVAQRAGARLAQLRRASLAADGEMGTFLREIFGAVQMVQVAGAEERAAQRLTQLNELRRKRVLQESLFQDVLVNSLLQNVGFLSTGLLLLLAWRYILVGAFTISDFALFTYFIPILSDFALSIGQSFAAYRQSGAAFERLAETQAPASAANLASSQRMWRSGPLHLSGPLSLSGPLPEFPLPRPPDAGDRLERLEISGLTCRHPGSGRGVEAISFGLEKGSFTAVTGRVGAGKTTLLQAVLGLLPIQAGEVRWNGQIVQGVLVPPRAAYVRQAPGLFSVSLRENILLGLSYHPQRFEQRLAQAVQAAVLERDLPLL